MLTIQRKKNIIDTGEHHNIALVEFTRQVGFILLSWYKFVYLCIVSHKIVGIARVFPTNLWVCIFAHMGLFEYG